jgi:hypothetical protein
VRQQINTGDDDGSKKLSLGFLESLSLPAIEVVEGGGGRWVVGGAGKGMEPRQVG